MDNQRSRKKTPAASSRGNRNFLAKKKQSAAIIPPSFPLSIGGYSIRFPYEQAYGPQLALMSNFLKALDRTLPPQMPDSAPDFCSSPIGLGKASHALLEAPTGTGKTLALLTAALEWQRSVRSRGGVKKLSESNIPDQEKPSYATKDMLKPQAIPEVNEQRSSAQVDTNGEDEIEIEEDSDLLETKNTNNHAAEDDDDFMPIPEKKETQPSKRKRSVPDPAVPHHQTALPVESPAPEKKRKKNPYSPKIYYATRTHAQVKKAISELRRTPYRPLMSILASRDHLCIHPQVSQLNSAGLKEQECKKLITSDPTRCGMELAIDHLADSKELHPPRGELQVWDVEDLADLGRSMSACPFFAAKIIEKKAELIFCPYNYLVEPAIRESMGISIDDSILIIDEAHNIEDSARDAASFRFTLLDLADASRQLQLALSTDDISLLVRKEATKRRKHVSVDSEIGDNAGGFVPSPSEQELARLLSWFRPLAEVLAHLHRWLQQASESSLEQQEFDKLGNTWGSDAILSLLQQINVTSDNIAYLKNCFTHGLLEYELLFGVGAAKNPAGALFTAKCLSFVEGLIQVFEFMLQDGMTYIGAYKLLMENTRELSAIVDGSWICTVTFLCLHGAAAFRPIVARARAIILVSGTLAPFDGLRAELGLDPLLSPGVPQISLTTGHVLRSEAQLSVIRISQYGSMPLRVDYKNQDRAEFQDAIGDVLSQLISRIPDGTVVFLPSYSMMEKLSRRWKSTGLWNRLNTIKPVFCEPKGSSGTLGAPAQNANQELQQVWTGYDKAIKSGKGGVFFGVCRGKLSEGMDFQDEYARAVIIIGIPFAHVRSTAVQLKKEFNAEKQKSDARFLSGSAWYTLQAFRALNQSIGRVVRHRLDYGAIILLDERFGEKQNELQLSSWARRSLKPPMDLAAAASTLSQFFPAAATSVKGGT